MPNKQQGDGITLDNLKDYHNTHVAPFLGAGGGQAYIPCGTIDSFMTTTAPQGYLICDGTEYLKTQYPKLAEVLGAVDTANGTTIFVGSDSDHFKVPDLRGEFLRGTGTNGHTGEGDGGNVGVHQDGTEDVRIGSNSAGKLWWYAKANQLRNADVLKTSKSPQYLVDSPATWSATSEAVFTSRPTNTSVLFCIAYQDLYLSPRHQYSTNEHVVGTWIDGRPVYEKTYDFKTITNSRASQRHYEIYEDISSLNIDTVVDILGIWDDYITSSQIHNYKKLPQADPGGTTYINLACGYPQDKLSLLLESSAPTLIVSITIQYTKTTD